MTLIEILFSMGISSFMICAILGMLTHTFLHKKVFDDIFNELQKSSRIISTIESRIANAGLGVPSGEKVEEIFKLPSSSISMLPGWTDVIEVLSNSDMTVGFQNIDGEQVTRGERIRILTTNNAASDIKIIPDSTEWGKFETRTLIIRKPAHKNISYYPVPGELSSWITTPSFGRPIVIKSLTAPYASNSGSIELQSPLFVSSDWCGIDMFHTFRISYFFVEAETLYIRDTNKRDTTNAIPSVSLHKEPVVDEVLSACFELNKTAKTLSCWFLIRSYSPSVKPGIPHGWPAWATIQPNIAFNKLKVVHHSWRLKNI